MIVSIVDPDAFKSQNGVPLDTVETSPARVAVEFDEPLLSTTLRGGAQTSSALIFMIIIFIIMFSVLFGGPLDKLWVMVNAF